MEMPKSRTRAALPAAATAPEGRCGRDAGQRGRLKRVTKAFKLRVRSAIRQATQAGEQSSAAKRPGRAQMPIGIGRGGGHRGEGIGRANAGLRRVQREGAMGRGAPGRLLRSWGDGIAAATRRIRRAATRRTGCGAGQRRPQRETQRTQRKRRETSAELDTGGNSTRQAMFVRGLLLGSVYSSRALATARKPPRASVARRPWKLISRVR